MSEVENREFNELSEEFVMDSLQLCETINKYRQEEGKSSKLEHNDLLKVIRKEIEALKNTGIKDEGNFSLISYTDSMNRSKPCYALTKFGSMLILNKESAYVRYKTQVYIEELEFRNSVLEVPYNEMAEDRLINGFNFKEIVSYLEYASIDDLNAIKDLRIFKDIGIYPYAGFVKQYFDTTDIKHLEKIATSKDIKNYGINTLSTQEFIDLLESNSITYRSIPNKICISDVVVTKGKIKVLSDQALIYLALTIKGSEVANKYREYLLNNQLIDLQQINQITNEKDIKAIHQLQIEVKMIMDRLYEKEDILNEREKLLNQRESNIIQKETVLKNYTVEDKGKMKLRDRIKKAFKILFGGDNYNTHEIIVVKHEFEQSHKEEVTPKIEIDNNETVVVEVVETEINDYAPPIATRQPICKEKLGVPVPSPIKEKDYSKKDFSISELRNDFKTIVLHISKTKNIKIEHVYGEVYRNIEKRFHITINKPNPQTSKLNVLRPIHLKYGIEYLNNTYL